MAPSLLKKMSGSRERVEGNYTSLDSFPLLETSLNNDLGLTLLPGSQTQKENDCCSSFVTQSDPLNYSSHDGRRQTTTGQRWNHQTSCRTRSLVERAPTRVDSHSPANHLNAVSRDGNHVQYIDSSPQAQKRRKIENRARHQSLDVTGRESLCVDANGRRPSSTRIVGPDDVQLDGAQESGLVLSITKLNSVEKEKVSNTPVSTSPSGTTSNFRSRVFGSLPDDSPDSFVPGAHKKVAHAPKTLNSHLQIPNRSVSEDLELPDADFWISSVVSKPLVEIQRSEDSQSTVHGKYPVADTATNASSQRRSVPSPSTFDTETSLQPAVLNPVTKATRSWTSHFPEASISLHARHDRGPATFPAAAASLLPTAEHQHTPFADRASSTRNHQKPTASSQSQPQVSLTHTLLPARVSGSRSTNRPTHRLRNITIVEHLQYPACDRPSSLPNLPSRHRMSVMDPARGYKPSALPTPPNENLPLPFQRSHSLSSPTAAPNMWGYAENGVFDGLTPFTTSSTPVRKDAHHTGHYPYNHSTHQNTYPPTNTMPYHPEAAKHQHFPSDGGFERSSTQAFFSNGSMTPAIQQFNGHTMQPKGYYSHPEIQDLLNGWHQLWGARSRRSDAAHQSQLSQEKTRSQNFSDEITRLNHESKQLKLNLGKLQQERDFLRGCVQAHGQGEMLQRFQDTYNILANQHQEVAFLRRENERLNEANNQLIFKMERLAAQPRPNAAVAKNMLHALSSDGSSAPFPGYDNRGITASGSHPMTVPTARPVQGSSTREDNAGRTSLHQIQVQSRCMSAQPERQAMTFPTGLIAPQAPSGAVTHITSSLPTNLVESPSFAQQSGSAPHTRSNFMRHGGITEDTSPQQVMIDLTDDLPPSSSSEQGAALVPQTHLPSAHEKAETEQNTEALQAQAAQGAAFNKKDFAWMDGLHPGRAIRTPGVNFGLPSSKGALAARAQIPPKKSANMTAKKIKDVMAAVGSVDDVPNEQPRNDQVGEKRAKSVASKKKYVEKKRGEQGTLSIESSVAPNSASQAQKQARKSAKVQKRQQAASQPLAEFHGPKTQCTLDGISLEEHIKNPQSASTYSRAQHTGAYSGPAIDDVDDMEVIHFPEYTANEDQDEEMTPAQFQPMSPAEAEIGTDTEDGVAKLHATLTADTEAIDDSDDVDDGVAAFEAEMEAEARALEAAGNGLEESSAAVTSGNTDVHANDDQSEESEEE